LAAHCVVLVGIEAEPGDQSARISREAAGAAAKLLAGRQRSRVAFFGPFPDPAAAVCNSQRSL
jgi:hypothetical protein